MKLITSLVILLAVANGCGQKTDRQADVKNDVDPNEKLCIKAAEKLISTYSRSLRTQLMSAMKEGGPAAAVEFCNIEAPRIAANYYEMEFISVRRVSDRSRNPSNQADSSQLEALSIFRDTGVSKIRSFGRWAETSRGRQYNFYKAIVVGQSCLKCHGGPGQVDSKVAEILKEKYPDDKATGYKSGDLRGMFVVEIDWPQGKDAANEIVYGNR